MLKLKQVFFDWSIDHLVEAVATQIPVAALMLFLGTSVPVALLAGALVATARFFGREHAQYEYYLANNEGYDMHAVGLAYFKSFNPFVWKQKADFFVPTLFTLGLAATSLLTFPVQLYNCLIIE